MKSDKICFKIFCWMNKNDGWFNSWASTRVVIFHSIHMNTSSSCFYIYHLASYIHLGSKCVKNNSFVCHKTISHRNKALQQHLSTISGNSNKVVSVQAGKLVKLFDQDTKLNILKMGNIRPVQISPEYMVAMKVDLAIPCWEKLKTISSYLVYIKHLKIMAKF